MKLFKLNLRTPVETLFSEEVESVSLNTAAGRIVVLPGHIDLTGNIDFTDVKLKHNGKDKVFFARNGIVHVDKSANTVDVLCFSIKKQKEVEYADVEKYLAWIEERLGEEEFEGKKISSYQYSFLENEKIGLVKKLEEFESSKK